MKNLFLILTITCFFKTAFAQKELVTLDEHNKYIYYHVAEMPGISADTLYSRLLAGIAKNKRYNKLKLITTGNSISLKSKLMLYTDLLGAKHEAGELAYTLVTEFKDGKYRYWLTDFVFMPYQRTRYGVYLKMPGIEVPLEGVKAKYDGKILDSYLEQIAGFGKDLGEEMTLYTATPQKKAAQPVKVDTRKW